MRQELLIEHIWARHQYAVLARSKPLHDRVAALVASDPPLVVDAVELMAEALTAPPSRGGFNDAVGQAWSRLGRGAGTRDDLTAALKRGRDEARLFLFRMATTAKDDVVIGASILDDEPIAGFGFYAKGTDWWQVREKNGLLSSLPVGALLNRAAASARPEAVLAGEGILRRIAGTVYADPRFEPTLRVRKLWKDSWSCVATV